MQLHEAITLYLDAIRGEIAASTWGNYRRCLRKLEPLADRPLREITAADLRRVRSGLIDRHRPASVNSYRAVWTTFFNWLVTEKYLGDSPARGLRKVKTVRELRAADLADARRMIALAAERDRWRDVAIMTLLMTTGLRVSAVCRIKLRDLDMNRGAITVIEKGSAPHTVHLIQPALESILYYVNVERPASSAPWLFLSYQNPERPIVRGTIWYLLDRYARWLNITSPVNPHAWRHMFVVEMLRNGASLDVVSKLVGHRSVAITEQYYARWQPARLRTILEECNPLQGVDR